MDIRPYADLDRNQQAAVRGIYERSFEWDERADFEEVERLAGGPDEAMAPVFLAGLDDGRVLGLSTGVYLKRARLGYLCYLAVDPAMRGRGRGRRLFEAGIAGMEARGVEAHGALPAFHFWECRRVEDAPDPAERAKREARIRFYRGLGAHPLPVTYLCPSIGGGRPEIYFTLMAFGRDRTLPFTREHARAAALAGLVEGNGAAPDGPHVRLALDSLMVAP